MIPVLNKKRSITGLFLVFLVYTTLVGSAGVGQRPQAQVEYSNDPATLVLSFSEVFPEFADQDLTPLVRIYGDGRLVVFHPAYSKRAGQYQAYLSQNELQSLLRQFTPLLLDFNAKEIRRLKKDADYLMVTQAKSLQDVTVYYESDPAISNFHLNIESYQAGGVPAVSTSVVDVSWRGLQFDAKNYKGLKPIQGLMAMERSLRALTRRNDLRKVKP